MARPNPKEPRKPRGGPLVAGAAVIHGDKGKEQGKSDDESHEPLTREQCDDEERRAQHEEQAATDVVCDRPTEDLCPFAEVQASRLSGNPWRRQKEAAAAPGRKGAKRQPGLIRCRNS